MIRMTGLVRAMTLAIGLGVHQGLLADAEADFERGRRAYYNDDVIAAMQSLQRAADQGHSAAQVLLAQILDRAEENDRALALYERAAGSGNADGMYGLASMYAAGDGVKQDDAQAVYWLEQATQRGHGQAIVALAEAHLKGSLGLPPDRDKALALLREGADRGYGPAQERLTRLTSQ